MGSGRVYGVRTGLIGSGLILWGQAEVMGSGRGDGVRWVPRLLIGPYKGRLLGWPYVAQPPHFLL